MTQTKIRRITTSGVKIFCRKSSTKGSNPMVGMTIYFITIGSPKSINRMDSANGSMNLFLRTDLICEYFGVDSPKLLLWSMTYSPLFLRLSNKPYTCTRCPVLTEKSQSWNLKLPSPPSSSTRKNSSVSCVWPVPEPSAARPDRSGGARLGGQISHRIPTCVGIAPTKTLAKFCNHIITRTFL